MAHPFAEHKENKVAHDRVKSITKGYAAGGGVLKSDDLPNSTSKKGATGGKGATGLIKPQGAIGGKAMKPRLDRPAFAKGGRANGKTNVNVIIAGNPGQGDQPPPMPIPPPQAAPPPPLPPRPAPMAPPGAGPPGGMPPSGMTIRKSGGRVQRADGGEVPVVKPVGPTGRERIGPDGKVSGFKSGGRIGGAKAEGMKNGTQVTHTPGKNDLSEISNSPPKLTRKKGGRVYPIEDGAGSGPGRLEKTKAYG